MYYVKLFAKTLIFKHRLKIGHNRPIFSMENFIPLFCCIATNKRYLLYLQQ